MLRLPLPSALITKIALGVALGLVAAALATLLGLTGFARSVEMDTYDLRVARTAVPTAPSDNILFVTIDDDSVRRMEPLVGHWPWPRLVHAGLIDYLAAAGAKAIVYDILFAEADRRRFMVGDTEWTGEESDQALVDATAKAGIVIHAAEAASSELLDPTRAITVPLAGIPGLNIPYSVDGCVERQPIITPPFPTLAQAARAIGHSRVTLDADGPLRRVAPFIRIGDRVVPSLSLLGAMLATAVGPEAVRVDAGGLLLDGKRVPLVDEVVPDFYGPAAHVCRALVPWRGPTLGSGGLQSFRSFSFYDLFYSQQQLLEGIKPDVDPAPFRDRIAVVGVSAQGLGDVFTTPFPEGRMPGAEVHANVIDGLLAGRSIAPASPWHAAALIVGAALVVSMVGAFASSWVTGVAALLVAGVLAFFNLRAFAAGVWWPLITPIVAVGLAFVGDLGWQYFVEGREKRKVKKLFSRYVAKDVYDQLLADPSRAALGGTRRQMTVLFSDMRGFTALTEKGAPEDIVAQLNEYFTRMVDVLFEHRGTLDKFVGDMVMALFGAPLDDDDHADHAVQAALAMTRALKVLNAEWASFGRPTLGIGIGINSGDMVAGNIGSDTIMSYTVIGDAVNLGARLESLNKHYGTQIIISEATRARLKGQYDVRSLGDVTVKGKSQAVAIYEVIPS